MVMLLVPKLLIGEHELEGTIIRLRSKYPITEASSWVLMVKQMSLLMLLLLRDTQSGTVFDLACIGEVLSGGRVSVVRGREVRAQEVVQDQRGWGFVQVSI